MEPEMPRSESHSRHSSRSASSIPDVKRNSRSSISVAKTEVVINVYDLLPSGLLSSFLWRIGLPLLHTGVVLNSKEYAYGATAGQTGVFWTKPRSEPLGATFRCSVLQGFVYLTHQEIEKILVDAGNKFPGDEYNLLTHNCNHFTNYMCRVLTQRDSPAWINRASKVGQLLPCIVPKEWVSPPEIDCDEDDSINLWNEESASMLRAYRETQTGVDLSSQGNS